MIRGMRKVDWQPPENDLKVLRKLPRYSAAHFGLTPRPDRLVGAAAATNIPDTSLFR